MLSGGSRHTGFLADLSVLAEVVKVIKKCINVNALNNMFFALAKSFMQKIVCFPMSYSSSANSKQDQKGTSIFNTSANYFLGKICHYLGSMHTKFYDNHLECPSRFIQTGTYILLKLQLLLQLVITVFSTD